MRSGVRGWAHPELPVSLGELPTPKGDAFHRTYGSDLLGEENSGETSPIWSSFKSAQQRMLLLV